MNRFSFLSRLAPGAFALLAVSGLLRASDAPGSSAPDSGNLRTFVELVRKDVRAEKALILAQNIDFTRDEAVDFWPLYSEYELELSKWYDRRLALIKGYLEHEKTMTDHQVRKLAEEVFGLEEKRTDLKRKYFKKFSRV